MDKPGYYRQDGSGILTGDNKTWCCCIAQHLFCYAILAWRSLALDAHAQ